MCTISSTVFKDNSILFRYKYTRPHTQTVFEVKNQIWLNNGSADKDPCVTYFDTCMYVCMYAPMCKIKGVSMTNVMLQNGVAIIKSNDTDQNM